MQNTHIMNAYEVCKSAMAHGFVKFSYTKTNGEHRIAIGTRCPQMLVRCNATPKGLKEEVQESNTHFCPYFDLTKGGWRCFKEELFGALIFDQMTAIQACAEAITLAIKANALSDKCIASMSGLLGDKYMSRIMNFSTLHDCTCMNASETERHISNMIESVVHDCCDTTNSSNLSDIDREEPACRKSNREELIAELKQLRERETEILTQLLGE